MHQTEISMPVHWGFKFFGLSCEEKNIYVKHLEEISEGK